VSNLLRFYTLYYCRLTSTFRTIQKSNILYPNYSRHYHNSLFALNRPCALGYFLFSYFEYLKNEVKIILVIKCAFSYSLQRFFGGGKKKLFVPRRSAHRYLLKTSVTVTKLHKVFSKMHQVHENALKVPQGVRFYFLQSCC